MVEPVNVGDADIETVSALSAPSTAAFVIVDEFHDVEALWVMIEPDVDRLPISKSTISMIFDCETDVDMQSLNWEKRKFEFSFYKVEKSKTQEKRKKYERCFHCLKYFVSNTEFHVSILGFDKAGKTVTPYWRN